jgi:hypothetical protein
LRPEGRIRLLAGFGAEIVAGGTSRTTDESTRESIAADGVGKKRASRSAGEAALEIGVDTARKAESRGCDEGEE